MKKKPIFRHSIGILLLLINSVVAYANEKKNTNDHCESPYFRVIAEDDETNHFPLESTDVTVNITGVIADVNVKQTYTNSGHTTIEAVYVFPASTRAAVYAMEMKVGERIIKAKIKEKQKAKEDYEAAKKEGKTASLLEEERPNVFKMNVANIIPGATVEVNLCYTELLVPTAKIYEFVYPTVVGPRYISNSSVQDQTHESWTENPHLEADNAPTSTLNILVKLNSSIPIKTIRCETHKNKINYNTTANASLRLDEPQGGNRDFVMQYRLAGDEIESGVMVYDNPDGENFFLAMMQPPAQPEADIIPAREYVFIVDVSGSMRGFPLNISKELMQSLFSGMTEKDLFNVVFFAGSSYMYAEKSLPVTDENIEKAIEFVNQRAGGGGTELLCALQAAMGLDSNDAYARSFVMITDGYVTVEKETFDYIRQHLGNANFFSFGIGRSVNRYIIEGMAHVGYGEPFIALNEHEANKEAKKFKQYISQPVMTNISYQFEDFEAYDMVQENIPDLFAERPVIISGKYKGKAQGKLKITGTTGKSTITKTIDIKPTDNNTKALKYLWAREKIRLLGDYNSLGKDRWSSKDDLKEKLESEITALGLKYNLLTEYTSFVAIDSEISNANGEQTTVNQALPLPQDVSNSALSGQAKGMVIRGMSKTTHHQNATSANNMNFGSGVITDCEIIELREEREEGDENKVFMVVEKMPSFPGGDIALNNYLSNNVKYPSEAANKGIGGRVYVEFEVDTLGNIINVKILKGVHPLLDTEALRVIKAMPQWVPGQQKGKKVRVSYRLPINFSNNSKPKNIAPVHPTQEAKPGIVVPRYTIPPC